MTKPLEREALARLGTEILYLRDRIRFHAAKAEYWQAQVKQMEDAADIEGPRRAQGRLERQTESRGLLRRKVVFAEQDPAYQVGAVLRDRTDYKGAVGNRNSHQTQVTMYAQGLTALMASLPIHVMSTVGQHLSMSELAGHQEYRVL